MLNINTKKDGAKLCVDLEGRLDTVTAPDLEKCFKEALPGTAELTIDCQKLDYVSSAGLRVLLSTQKIMNKQGSMKLTHVSESIMEIFEVTGFTDILTIE